MSKKNLNQILETCLKTDYYKENLNIKNTTDVQLCNLPITTKEKLRLYKPLSMLVNDCSSLYDYHESFGTTGTPVSTWFTKNDFDAYVNQINESDVNFNSSDKVLIRFPYAISVPAHTFTKAVHLKGGCVIPVSRASLVTPFPRVINLLKKLDVTVLACNVFEAFQLAFVAKKLGLNPHSDFKNLRAICVAGEMLSDERKKRLESLWNVDVFNFYGTTEIGNIATSCKYGNLHCSEDFIYEVLDADSNKPVKSGKKGVLHVTTLNKEAFPLIRYNVGDIVQLVKSDCPCGKKGFILIHHGRISDQITFNNSSITMKELQEALLNNDPKVIGDIWKFKKLNNKLQIYVESESYISKNNPTQLNINIPHEIIYKKPGSLFNVDKLLKIDVVNKPTYIL